MVIICYLTYKKRIDKAVPKMWKKSPNEKWPLKLVKNVGERNELFVYKKGIGRLGNKLFQYAAALGIAYENNRQALFDKNMLELKDVFPEVILNITDTPPKWTRVPDQRHHDTDGNLFRLPGMNITLSGYLESFRYFERISSWLYKNIFSRFNPIFLSNAKRFIEEKKREYKRCHRVVPKSICVHIRRGDKANLIARNKSNYKLPSSEEIFYAMNYMKKKYKHVVFIMASDSKQWCTQHLQKHNVYISNMTTLYEDFVLISSCDHMIMTVGTFGWWAAWLTSQRGGTVMYYNQPYKPESRNFRTMNMDDCFPSNWITYNSSTITQVYNISEPSTKREKLPTTINF